MFGLTRDGSPGDLLIGLKRFIEYWLGPREERFGVSEGELNAVSLPEPLRELYAFAGNWPSHTGVDQTFCVDIFSTQDGLLRFDQLRPLDDKLVFIDENQGCWSLATLRAGEDPPVWGRGDGIGGDDDRGWVKVNDSLTHLLITFCFQELVFGAKEGHWDAQLTEYFRGGSARIEPLWLDGSYVWSDMRYSFHLLDDAILVGDFGGGECYFAANRDAGFQFLREKEGPVVGIGITTVNDWSVRIERNGSASLYLSGWSDSGAKTPGGIFQFDELLRELQGKLSEEARFGQHPVVFLYRSGRGCTQGTGVLDRGLVRRVFRRAVSAVTEKESRFEEKLGDVPIRV